MRLQINQQIAQKLSRHSQPPSLRDGFSRNPISSVGDGDKESAAMTVGSSFEAQLEAAIALASANHGVDANLIRAIIRVESNYNPLAVSHAGAMGLMQLMPATAERLGVSNVFDINENINAGTQYMASLLQRFDGDVSLALAAYNAGWPRVVAAGNAIPNITETINYVPRVLNFKEQYIMQEYAANKRR